MEIGIFFRFFIGENKNLLEFTVLRHISMKNNLILLDSLSETLDK